jgi:hypothetical protein
VEYYSLVLKLHLTFGGMDVHIDRMKRNSEKEDPHGKAAGGH